jgi:hypothetical protein
MAEHLQRLRRNARPAVVAAATLAACVGLGTLGDDGRAAARGADVYVSVDHSKPVAVSRLRLGVTHTQHSLDPWGDKAAIARGKRLLTAAVTYQNQAIYGWGARNPNPRPGVYDWRSLDRRVALIRSMGATPVITLCCAPDWMTRNGTNKSSYPNVPPTPAHYADFAALARRVARRYPDVKHYLVWNEMKGFWDHASNNWDYERYTQMYNRVWLALKSVNPAIRVGGPYMVIEGSGSRQMGKSGYATADPITERDWEVIHYWMRHKLGADFLAIDRKTVSSSHDRNHYTRAQQLRLTPWFGRVVRRLRRVTRLPVWFAEDYFLGARSWRFQAAGLASMLRHEARSGASVSLRWGPQGDRGDPFGGNDQALFSDTRRPGGGKPFPAYAAYKAMHDHFRPGTRLYRTRSSSSAVEVLASARRVLLINKSASGARVHLGRRTIALPAYAVRVVDGRAH